MTQQEIDDIRKEVDTKIKRKSGEICKKWHKKMTQDIDKVQEHIFENMDAEIEDVKEMTNKKINKMKKKYNDKLKHFRKERDETNQKIEDFKKEMIDMNAQLMLSLHLSLIDVFIHETTKYSNQVVIEEKLQRKIENLRTERIEQFNDLKKHIYVEVEGVESELEEQSKKHEDLQNIVRKEKKKSSELRDEVNQIQYIINKEYNETKRMNDEQKRMGRDLSEIIGIVEQMQRRQGLYMLMIQNKLNSVERKLEQMQRQQGLLMLTIQNKLNHSEDKKKSNSKKRAFENEIDRDSKKRKLENQNE